MWCYDIKPQENLASNLFWVFFLSKDDEEDIQHLPLGFLDWCVSVALFSVKYTIVGVLSSFKLKYQDFVFVLSSKF